MPLGDAFDSFGPQRHTSGRSNPNYMAPQGPAMGPHSWLQPFERSQYFEENPRQAFNAFSDLFGRGDKRRSLLDSFSPIFDIYLGNVGADIMEGGTDRTGGWSDFLSGTGGFDQPFDFNKFYRDNFVGQSERADARLDQGFRYLY